MHVLCACVLNPDWLNVPTHSSLSFSVSQMQCILVCISMYAWMCIDWPNVASPRSLDFSLCFLTKTICLFYLDVHMCMYVCMCIDCSKSQHPSKQRMCSKFVCILCVDSPFVNVPPSNDLCLKIWICSLPRISTFWYIYDEKYECVIYGTRCGCLLHLSM